MTAGHLPSAQEAFSPFVDNFWDTRGWGFGMSVINARRDLADVPGRFGWDGAFGTSWYVDPKERMIGIFMNQLRPDLLRFSEVASEFWTSTDQSIDD